MINLDASNFDELYVELVELDFAFFPPNGGMLLQGLMLIWAGGISCGLKEAAMKEIAAQLPFPLYLRFYCFTHQWNNLLRFLL